MRKSITVTLAIIITLLVGSVVLYFVYSSEQANSISIFDINNLNSKVTFEDLSKHFDELNGCFVLYDMNKDEYSVYNQENSQKRMEPGLTFNVINTLIGLEKGVLKNEKIILNEVKEQLGKDEIKEYLDKLQYGNWDTLGDKKKLWFSSSLKISALEQVEMIRQLYTYELPFSSDNIDIVKKAMVISKENNGVLSGISHSEKNKNTWYVGYLEQGSNVYMFATYIEDENTTDDQIAKEVTEKILSDKTTESIKKKRGKVVYEIPNMEKVNIIKDIVYKVDNDKEFKLDIYYPLEDEMEKIPHTIILVHGSTPDQNFKDKKYFTSWGKLVAAAGLPAVTFNWRSYTTPTDISDLILFVREHADELKISGDRISIIAFSLGVEDGIKEVLSVDTGFIDSIVAYYGKLPIPVLDSTTGKELPPMFIAEAAHDNVIPLGSNAEFINKANTLGYSITSVVHSEGAHGFDVFTDNEESYEIIKRSLDFIKFNSKNN